MISTVDQAREQSSILPILVLYEIGLGGSSTFHTFRDSARLAGGDPNVIVVYDNSKVRQVSTDEETRLLAYKHDPDNSGLAAAYNWGLNLAQQRGFSWLLLLDQDTRLPVTFVPTLMRAVLQYSTDETVAAIVPFATDNGVSISPKRVRVGHRTSLTSPIPKIADYEVTAINSGAAVRVSFVTMIGGFNPTYRLDCLDHWFFRQVYANGNKAALLDETLEHNLSVSDYRHQVSLDRYRSILRAEVNFAPQFLSTKLFRLFSASFVYYLRS